MKSLMDMVQSTLRGFKCGKELKERVDTYRSRKRRRK
jgi:hypothetical protein